MGRYLEQARSLLPPSFNKQRQERSHYLYPCPLPHSPPHKKLVPCSLPASVRKARAMLVAACFSSPVVSPGLRLLLECRSTASAGRSVLPAAPFLLPPSLTGTCSNPASSGLGTYCPSRPHVWPLWGVASTPDRQARLQVRRLSGLFKPFGVVVPGRLSFGPPCTPAPNLCAGAARTPLRTSLVHPSALRTSAPLTKCLNAKFNFAPCLVRLEKEEV
ncbi:hypothetical protein T12_11085 [Trichinella patagoniensis]|uniref:Uncharacterized protein n=1 Tax=Trichinella patagoniensis TaxID=990121 RepID=A0A0V1A3M3_9BILA|nr:hypothetical protein T12_11085 [Trichinella patagoniensis]